MINLPAKKTWKPGQVQVVIAVRNEKGTVMEFKAPRVTKATMEFILERMLKPLEPHLEPGDKI